MWVVRGDSFCFVGFFSFPMSRDDDVMVFGLDPLRAMVLKIRNNQKICAFFFVGKKIGKLFTQF
jgi:hypothetical protein